MSIQLGGLIYAIIRGDNGELYQRTFPLALDYEPSNAELRQPFNYSIDLRNQYTSDLPYIACDLPLNAYADLFHRRNAIAFKQTIKRIKLEYDVVAYSHRRGGWHTFKWNYNDYIKFLICTNFGYGSSSEFISRFYYKEKQLTPYSDYILYRYAGYSEIIRYTYKYRLDYNEWSRLMEDTLVFYNAICENEEHEVFQWIRNHLNIMVSGLEKLFTAQNYFDFPQVYGSNETVSGNDLEVVKAEKISGSIDFVKNIEDLPTQINSDYYIKRIKDLTSKYADYAKYKIVDIKNEILKLEHQLESIEISTEISVYERLKEWHYYKEKWYNKSNNFKMIKCLLSINKRLHKPFLINEVRSSLNKLNNLLNTRGKLQRNRDSWEYVLLKMEQALSKIESFKDS